MPDRETTQQQSHQSEQERGQASFDSSFIEQMSQGGGGLSSLGYDVTSQVVQSYFDQIEAQTRQARRMADLWAQSLILQQTTNQIAQVIAPSVAKQVVQYFKSNPQQLKELVNR